MPAGPVYDPQSPGLFVRGAWNLLEIQRGSEGTRDPRKKRAFRGRRDALTLRVPRFIEDPRYVFPPVNLVRRNDSPVAGTSGTITLNCLDSPARPWKLKVSPQTPLPDPGELMHFRLAPIEIPIPNDTVAETPRPGTSAEARTPLDPGAATADHAEQGPARTPATRTPLAESDSETLFLSAYETPETFSPSLLGSPSPKRFCGNHRRNLRFD